MDKWIDVRSIRGAYQEPTKNGSLEQSRTPYVEDSDDSGDDDEADDDQSFESPDVPQQPTAQKQQKPRSIEKVVFGQYLIKTWRVCLARPST